MSEPGQRRRLRPLLVAGLLLLAAACSDERASTDASTRAPETSAASSADAEQTVTSAEPSLPAPIAPKGAKNVNLDDVQDLSLEISDGPDWLATGFGSLWVKRDNGSVLRVAPSGKLLATLDAHLYQPPVCQGIGVSPDAVWACATQGRIVRIDPRTNEITARLSIPKINEQGRLVSAAGRLWVLNVNGDQLRGISFKDESLSDPIKLGAYCTDLAVGDDETLWVVCASEGLLLRVRPDTGEVTGRVAGLANATNAAVAGDVWVGFDGGVARIDKATLHVQAVYGIYPGLGGGIRASSHAVWIRQEGDPFLTRIDPRTGDVVEAIHSKELSSGGDVIEMGANVWVTASDDNRLVRLSD